MVKWHLTFRFFAILSIVFTCSSLFALPRPNPFYPSTTNISSNDVAQANPFDSYQAVGYAEGPDHAFIIMKNSDGKVFYISKGMALGLEKFRLTNIREKKDRIVLVFSKQVHDLNGEKITIHRHKKISKE